MALCVVCVCLPSRPHTPRYQHYTEPSTTSTFARQFIPECTELRHCCFLLPVCLQRALQKNRPVPKDRHDGIRRAPGSPVDQSAGVCRWARRKGHTSNTVLQPQHLWIYTARDRCTPGHAQRDVVHDKFLEQPHFGPSTWLRRSNTLLARQYI